MLNEAVTVLARQRQRHRDHAAERQRRLGAPSAEDDRDLVGGNVDQLRDELLRDLGCPNVHRSLERHVERLAQRPRVGRESAAVQPQNVESGGTVSLASISSRSLPTSASASPAWRTG